jgi:hypothetical protein
LGVMGLPLPPMFWKSVEAGSDRRSIQCVLIDWFEWIELIERLALRTKGRTAAERRVGFGFGVKDDAASCGELCRGRKTCHGWQRPRVVRRSLYARVDVFGVVAPGRTRRLFRSRRSTDRRRTGAEMMFT